MRNLYESILDDETAKYNKMVLASKDYIMFDLNLNTGDFSKINPAKFIDWRKLQSDVKKFRAQSDWVQYDNFTIYNPLVELIMNQPVIGHTQNVAHTIQRYAKPGYYMILGEITKLTNGMETTEYILKKGHSPEDELDIVTHIAKKK